MNHEIVETVKRVRSASFQVASSCSVLIESMQPNDLEQLQDLREHLRYLITIVNSDERFSDVVQSVLLD